MPYTPDDYDDLPDEIKNRLSESFSDHEPLMQTAVIHGMLMIPMDADHRAAIDLMEEDMEAMGEKERALYWREHFARMWSRTDSFLRRREPMEVR